MDDNATRERLVVRKLPSSSIFIAPIAKLKWNRINGLIKKYQFKHGSLIFPVPTFSPSLPFLIPPWKMRSFPGRISKVTKTSNSRLINQFYSENFDFAVIHACGFVSTFHSLGSILSFVHDPFHGRKINISSSTI